MRSDVAPTDRPSGDGAFDQGFQADAVAGRIEAAEKIQGIAAASIVKNASHGARAYFERSMFRETMCGSSKRAPCRGVPLPSSDGSSYFDGSKSRRALLEKTV